METNQTAPAEVKVQWPGEDYLPPRVYDSGYPEIDGVKSIFYEGASYRGKPTRVFAYIAVPEAAKKGPVPGIVLVHGGDGSAFRRWVKFWCAKGYAAISMDTCGCVSGNEAGNEHVGHFPHEWSGPRGWPTDFPEGEKTEDQWAYHAVSAVIRGHSLLASLPGVDPARIGITGVSWGGYLTCMTASTDSRFAFAAPVYGCGFLDNNSFWNDLHIKNGTMEEWTRWASYFDPGHYLANAGCPFLFIDGTNDDFFPPDSLQKTCDSLPAGITRYRATRPRMRHAHFDGAEHPAELVDFADAILRNGKEYPKCLFSQEEDGTVTCRFSAGGFAFDRFVLEYTQDGGRWQTREWKSLPMTPDSLKCSASVKLPPSVSCWYANAYTEDGKCISGEFQIRR